MKSEPAVGTGGLISAGLYLLWIILSQTGISITEDLKDATEAFLLILFATPFVAGLLIRFQVTPTAKAETAIETERSNAQQVVNDAYKANPVTDPKPALDPKTTL